VEDGRITEFGGHDELLGASGAYAALWRSWQGGDDNTEPAAAP
jgi:ABC-type multidrug transport system fused ATPase/permease subunit